VFDVGSTQTVQTESCIETHHSLDHAKKYTCITVWLRSVAQISCPSISSSWSQTGDNFAVSTFSSPKREAASPFATTAMPKQKQNPRHRSEHDGKCHYLTCLHHGCDVISPVVGVVVGVALRLSRIVVSRIVVSVLVQSARGCRSLLLFATIARLAVRVVVAIDSTIITATVSVSPIPARISSVACRTVAAVVNIARARRSIHIADTTEWFSALGFQAISWLITFGYSWQVRLGASTIATSNAFKRIRFRSRGCC
jgi:hypothetical protein